MRHSRLILVAIAILLLLATLTSCTLPPSSTGGEGDSGNEGGGGNGGETVEKDPSLLYLVDNGQVGFHFVYSNDGLTQSMKNHVFGQISSLAKKGISVNAVRDDFDSYVQDCEVLIGTFRGREEYEVSKYTLGNKGYTIRVKDDKVIILGGTEESLKVAFDVFINECMVYDEGTRNVTIKRDFDKTVPEVYDITEITVAGTELRAGGFKIVCDPADDVAVSMAELLRIKLYNAGYYLDIVESTDGRGIYIVSAPRGATAGFRAYTEGDSLYIECQYPTLFATVMGRYLNQLVPEGAIGSLEIGYDYSEYLHTVSYLDFGAVGDGVTDDFAAIKAAHDFANEHGVTVDACGERRNDGLVFNVGAHDETVYIKTDVDWTGASFIIDDSQIAASSTASKTFIFTVASSLTVTDDLNGKIASLSKGATSIGVTLSQKYLAMIYDDNTKQYIRYGNNADSGASQQEVIIIHEDGSIDPSTPLLWNYTSVTKIILRPAGDVPITIKGGTFTTVANQAPRQYTYYSRGINVLRSNVTVEGITHLITGEGDTGAPYTGFLSVNGANNVLFKDIVYSGHKTYKLSTDASNSMGTYDISAGSSNAITWKNCTQANSITDKTLWGVMGSNYCKNLTYDGCTLSRFDAHKGMYNTTIVDSEIGHAGITAIGAGYLRIENTVINGNKVVSLRGDYGSTWDGEVIIKDVTLKNTSSTATLFGGSWYNHYFGYVCHLPSVTVDNLTLAKGTSVYIFPTFSYNDITSTSTSNPVALGGSITVKNNTSGYTFYVSSNSYVKNGYTIKYE